MRLARILLGVALLASVLSVPSSAAPRELCKPKDYFTSTFRYGTRNFRGETVFDLSRCWNITKAFEATASVVRESPGGVSQGGGEAAVACFAASFGGSDARVRGDCSLTYGAPHDPIDHSRYVVTISFKTRSGAKKELVIFDGTCTSTVVDASCG